MLKAEEANEKNTALKNEVDQLKRDLKSLTDSSARAMEEMRKEFKAELANATSDFVKLNL